MYLDMLLYDRYIIGAFSEIFGNLQKMSEKCLETFVLPSEKFWKIFGNWSEIFGKSLKMSSLVCLCNKQNITYPLVDMNFTFSCSTRHVTRSLRSLVRYRVEHSKIKFISTCGHVISSIFSQMFQCNPCLVDINLLCSSESEKFFQNEISRVQKLNV